MTEKDIDDLLDEIEADFPHSAAEEATSTSLSRDVDDILRLDAEDKSRNIVANPRLSASSTFKSSSEKTKRKCEPLLLGGSAVSTGLSTALKPRSCDKLMCLRCDFDVVSFDGVRWRRDTNYLFLRNNAPDAKRLRPNLQTASGYRAFACQCGLVSVLKVVRAANGLENEVDGENRGQTLQWICTKHHC